MINDNTHKNSLSNIALRLFSITPHSVMPERLFSILDWQHAKRRNRLNPFTLEAIAKIHTFYRNGSANTSDPVDTGSLEELLDLLDDSQEIPGNNDESNNATADVTDFMQCVNENHHVLRSKCEAEDIIEDQTFDDDKCPDIDQTFNVQDRDFQRILIDLELIDQIESSSIENDEMTEDELEEKVTDEDYDVEDLLASTIIT